MLASTRTLLVFGLLMTLAPAVLVAQPPVLKASYLYGGPGDQYGLGLATGGPHVYLAGTGYHGGLKGETRKINIADGTVIWLPTPTESTNQHDVAIDGSSVYVAGSALPPACGAVDGAGDTETKPLFGKYDIATGFKSFCGSLNYFGYRGHEGYHSMAGGSGTYYTAGGAEEFGFGGHRYIVGKYSSAGDLLDSATDPSTFSFAWGVALDAGGIYVSGFRRNSSWHGDPELPMVVKLDTDLNEVWRHTIDAAAVGASAQFYDLTTDGGFIYVVGRWTHSSGNEDFLAAKFSTAGGPPVWTAVWGTPGPDILRDVVVAGERLFAVGGSSGDVALVELNPGTGAALPGSSAFGGGGDDTAVRILAAGHELFVAGYSASFATPAGNTVGSYDALLLHYTLVLTVAIDIKPGSSTNSINLGYNGTIPVAILSSSTFDATTVDPATVTLAGASVALRGKGTPNASVEDVNGDGLPDLVVHVSTEALQLTDGDTQAVLTGLTYSGQPIQGSDSIRIVP